MTWHDRFFRALLELERSGLLPSSAKEANHAANRIRLRSTDGAIMAVLPEVTFGDSVLRLTFVIALLSHSFQVLLERGDLFIAVLYHRFVIVFQLKVAVACYRVVVFDGVFINCNCSLMFISG